MNGLAPSEEYLGMQNDLASAPNTANSEQVVERML
jgi:hypothetical protein